MAVNSIMGGDAERAFGAALPVPTAARLPPPWFDDDIRRATDRYAHQLAGMIWLERAAIAAGYNVRPIKR